MKLKDAIESLEETLAISSPQKESHVKLHRWLKELKTRRESEDLNYEQAWFAIKNTLQEIVDAKKAIIAEKKKNDKKAFCEEVPSKTNFEMVVNMMNGFEKEWK